MAVSVHAIADYFISKADREAGDDLTHLKLQKLVYYAQAWHLAMYQQPLFSNRIEAWLHGPVCREIYDRFRHLSWNPIPASLAYINIDRHLDHETIAFLDEIWEVYGQYSATRLEQMTHEEEPWIEARKNVLPGNPSQAAIGEETMARYYAARMVARRRIREKD
jgi:uncharacterized phage-associated protein